MENTSRLAKAHSKLVANEYIRLGWTLKAEFYAEAPYDDEPYEYFFQWEHKTDPIHIDWEEFHRKHGK